MKKTFLFGLVFILLVGAVFALTMEQGLKVTVLTGDINILSPMQDKIYDDRRIPVIILFSSEVDTFKVSDNGGRFRTLCRHCEDFGFWSTRIMGFTEGFHELEFVAVFNEEKTVSQKISFFIDSKAPRILKTAPKRNSVTNGSDFSVEYTEDNVKEVLISWNPVVNLTDQCDESGENVLCGFDLDLTAFNGQEIEYQVNITDIANHTTSSNPTKVLVDTTVPVLTVISPTEDSEYGRRVPFNLSVSEKVKLEYNDNGGAFNNLCNNCDSYGLTGLKTKKFSVGNHDIIIRATDKAGNSDSEAVSFDVA